ncbi:MAG: hypothetical protein U5R06_17680 [candidate division KSB1 bacterium]|nr:hypothetical protein [candidate division KSB1 bacterium]
MPDAFQGGHSLRVEYPQGGVGPGETGTQFPIVFRDMSVAVARRSARVRFTARV